MPVLTTSDLQFKYSWTAIPPDDARVTGVPDSTLLNRGEGYEVLAFLNRLATVSKWTDKASALKAERLIHTNLPGDVRSHAHVWKWLVDNWSNY
jgi:hypothetical protein